ncbi:hypothetical protein [Pseudomonas sp.]|uniref:hypothetical protein n=1 Tax=Pseudomonas sp. TaxID=306 RepID=UPI003D6FB8DE
MKAKTTFTLTVLAVLIGINYTQVTVFVISPIGDNPLQCPSLVVRQCLALTALHLHVSVHSEPWFSSRFSTH